MVWQLLAVERLQPQVVDEEEQTEQVAEVRQMEEPVAGKTTVEEEDLVLDEVEEQLRPEVEALAWAQEEAVVDERQ